MLVPVFAGYFESGDRLLIGNTAGTLSVLAELDDHRILIGAGPTRSHAADFVGRSTRPWDNHVDLLVIPGTIDTHATGALGLLERREVGGVAVVGTPGEGAIWTLLDRQAASDDVPVRYLNGPHRLELNGDVSLALSTFGDADTPGTLVRIEYHGARIDIVDSTDQSPMEALSPEIPPGNDHIVVAMHEGGSVDHSQPAVVLRPEPYVARDFDEPLNSFVGELRRNERISIELRRDEIRLPLDAVEFDGEPERTPERLD